MPLAARKPQKVAQGPQDELSYILTFRTILNFCGWGTRVGTPVSRKEFRIYTYKAHALLLSHISSPMSFSWVRKVVFFFLCFGATSNNAQGYSWLCILGSLLVGSEDHMGCQEWNPCQLHVNRTLPTVLSLQPHEGRIGGLGPHLVVLRI